ncbi:hypothetical protein [Streptomyces sp. DH37]|uniref:hypothetical protein n=1 Tax=Streptomyces sp. DH37 TaxID=3040122 RepID=UPI00244313C6|nr:hypothetical protein [Streptomyces sp. DH37]MDG9701688.1 hypothetical protein [Streptomyces sp. DH37]
MGFIDAIDDVLTTARGRHGAQREAAKFSRSVQLGRTYWAVAEFRLPTGGRKLAVPWTFDRKSRATGDPMCGAVSAAGAWLRCGPLHDSPPCQTLADYLAECAEADQKRRAQTDRELRALEDQVARIVDLCTARQLVRR